MLERHLLIDIGAGTMDILYYDFSKDVCYKAVVCSPTKHIARLIKCTHANLFISGYEMGGGSVTEALKVKAKSRTVIMTSASAKTVNHNFKKVEDFGIEISKESYKNDMSFCNVELADIQLDRIKEIVNGFGVPFTFDIVAVCAQDHGTPPVGVSHLDFRHKQFSAVLDRNPLIHKLMYAAKDIPFSMNRLNCIAKCASRIPSKKIYVMDSGMAAILGASKDINAENKKNIIVLDIATSHTVGAAIRNGIITSFFEYHTKDITQSKLEILIRNLPEGNLSHDDVLKKGGHGAYVRSRFKYDDVQAIIVTGPMRSIMKKSRLPLIFGAPLGDNMMTGTTGLLEAIRLKEKLPEINYV